MMLSLHKTDKLDIITWRWKR